MMIYSLLKSEIKILREEINGLRSKVQHLQNVARSNSLSPFGATIATNAPRSVFSPMTHSKKRPLTSSSTNNLYMSPTPIGRASRNPSGASGSSYRTNTTATVKLFEAGRVDETDTTMFWQHRGSKENMAVTARSPRASSSSFTNPVQHLQTLQKRTSLSLRSPTLKRRQSVHSPAHGTLLKRPSSAFVKSPVHGTLAYDESKHDQLFPAHSRPLYPSGLQKKSNSGSNSHRRAWSSSGVNRKA